MSKISIVVLIIVIAVALGFGIWFWRSKSVGDQNCVSLSGKSMTLDEAKSIAKASECGDRLKETNSCNTATGTWWIDLNIDKSGCSPACMVNVETKQAEINWRCTGLMQ